MEGIDQRRRRRKKALLDTLRNRQDVREKYEMRD
jgi:hypothetical protein